MTPREKYNPELENLEIELLLQGIQRMHGVDLQECSGAPVRRRIWEAIKRERARTVSGLQECLLHDAEALGRFLKSALPPVQPLTAEFLLKFRREVVPLLRTYPFARIWQIGCSSVFEAYALAIILEEEGIYDRCTIYGTDLHEQHVHQCYDGVFSLSQAAKYENLYERSGGRETLGKYYSGGSESGLFDGALRRNMVFSRHNLATDSSFNEFNAVLCRTPLNYFDVNGQRRANKVIHDSLVVFGILGLTPGQKLGELSPCYSEIDPEHHLYRKIA